MAGSRVEFSTLQTMSLTLNQFKFDRDGVVALKVLTEHLVATQHLLDLLNDPASEQQMTRAEELDRPPLAGIVHLLEVDAQLAGALGSRTSGKRFRSAVTVAVKIKMLDMGWSTTGRHGPVTNSRYFERGERFKH